MKAGNKMKTTELALESRNREASHCFKNFYPHAAHLREHFETRFHEPEKARYDRCVWDYWSIPNQYCHLRTPAYHFFPKELYEPFHRYLVEWGRKNLGCLDVSPPWLSCYVDGCFQAFHGDLPHGPWAFVFSLTPKKKTFQGGQTLLFKDEILSYWNTFEHREGLNQNHILEKIEPRWNQLLIFDPKIPHGVERVSNANSVLDGRLVIHGWFIQPCPQIDGPLNKKDLNRFISFLLKEVDDLFRMHGKIHGICTFLVEVSRFGKIQTMNVLNNRLFSANSHEENIFHGKLKTLSLRMPLKFHFAKQKSPSRVILPIIFD